MNKVITILLICFLLVSCAADTPKTVTICEEESMLNHFYVDYDTVHIICSITVVNDSLNDVEFTISAVSKEDTQNGLLMYPELTGINAETQGSVFSLASGKKVTFRIDFQGRYGGTERKVDRLIPDVIELQILPNE